MEWITVREKKPAKWSKVVCKTNDGKIYQNALYQFDNRFLDMDSEPTVDIMGGVYRERIMNVSEWMPLK